MFDKIEKSRVEILENRPLLVKNLLEWSVTDSIFFLSDKKALKERQIDSWLPIISWLEELFKTKVSCSFSFDVPKQTKAFFEKLEKEIMLLSDDKFVLFYIMVTKLRSVSLALAFIKNRIDAKAAFLLANLEELWQVEIWGVDFEAEDRREEIRKEIIELERVVNGIKSAKKHC